MLTCFHSDTVYQLRNWCDCLFITFIGVRGAGFPLQIYCMSIVGN